MSAKKIYVILSLEMAGQYVSSIATIGRGIKKYNMFYRWDIQAHKKPRKTAGKAAEKTALQKITQYWCLPSKPKDKSFIERFIGILQIECPDYYYEPPDVHDLLDILDERIFK